MDTDTLLSCLALFLLADSVVVGWFAVQMVRASSLM